MTGVSRRRFVQGAITAAVGCGTDPAPTRPTVAFVGQSPERGHAVIEAAKERKEPAEWIDAPILIVGGGAAGFAAAWRLARAGYDDAWLVELEDSIGGTARGGRAPRASYPMGAHYLPSPHPDFEALHQLLIDLDVVLGSGGSDVLYDPRYVCRAPVERHRYRGQWFEGIYPAAGQTADEEAQWEAWQAHLTELDARRGVDGRRLFELPVSRSSTELRALDSVSAADYLDRLGLDSWRLRWTVDYACRDDYGCRLEQTSAFAALHHYLSRGLEDLHDRVVLTWESGNMHLVEGMQERARLGERMRPGHAVIGIDPDEGSVRVLEIETGRVLGFRTEVVLWAAPRFVLSAILGQPSPGLTYSPWLVANVEVDRRPRGIGAPLAWDNVPIEADNLGYVVANHGESLADMAVPGAVLTYYHPFPGADRAEVVKHRKELLALSAPAAGAVVTDALEQMHPGIASTIRHIDVCRWGHAMVRPAPGVLFGPDLASARAPVGRVVPCAADTAGLPVFEEAFAGGVQAAELALSRVGRPASTIL